MTVALRMLMLHYGAERCPKSMSVRGGDATVREVPVIGALVETVDGWVLLDTGFSTQALADEAACRSIYTFEVDGQPTYCAPVGYGEDPFRAALAAEGLQVQDLALAAVSHLHLDHSGGIPALAQAGIPIVIQRRELDFGLGPAGLHVAYYRGDYEDRGVDWRVIDGDAEIAPGISAIFTPGHTPGHMSYRVELAESGTWILAFDAADLGQNLFDVSPPGEAADPADNDRSVQSLHRLLHEASQTNARLVPGHDPIFWRAVRHPAGGHR